MAHSGTIHLEKGKKPCLEWCVVALIAMIVPRESDGNPSLLLEVGRERVLREDPHSCEFLQDSKLESQW